MCPVFPHKKTNFRLKLFRKHQKNRYQLQSLIMVFFNRMNMVLGVFVVFAIVSIVPDQVLARSAWWNGGERVNNQQSPFGSYAYFDDDDGLTPAEEDLRIWNWILHSIFRPQPVLVQYPNNRGSGNGYLPQTTMVCRFSMHYAHIY